MSRRKRKSGVEQLEQELSKRLKDDMRHVMGSAQGRRFVYWLIGEHTGVFSQTFNGSANHTLHLEGRRSAGCELMAAIQDACPRDWGLAIQEAIQRQQEEELRREQEAARNSEGETDG